jgi:hypothetical protein
MSATASPPGLRISLREFLLVITAVVIGCASLKLANEYWLAAISLFTLLTFIALAVIAIVDRDRRQAWALGFVIGAGIYLALVFSMRVTGDNTGIVRTYNAELNPDEGWLPTTLAVRPIYDALHDHWYIDPSGTRIRQSDVPPAFQGGSRNSPSSGYGYAGEFPNRKHFMLIVHCLWALLFGYAGGHYARWVYYRRLREQNAAAQVAAG